jgi:hypothetical protein
LKYTITIEEMPDSMLRVGFSPSIQKIMDEATRTKKCSAAEETMLRIYEFIQKRSVQEQRARLAATSKIILPNANGTLPKFN